MIEIVSAATGGKRQPALLGNDIIELEFTKFEVQPRAVKQVVQAGVDRLDVKRAELI